MSQKANGGAIAAGVIVLVLIIGFIAWRTFSGGGKADDLATTKAHQAAKAKD